MLKPKLKPSWQFLLPLILALFFLSLFSSKTRRAPWYEQLAWNAVSPVTSILSWTNHEIADTLHHYLYLVGLSKRSEELAKEVANLQRQAVSYNEAFAENQRLTGLLDLRRQMEPNSIAARVVAYDPRSEFKTIQIDKGEKEGVKPDMPVVSREGLVGKVGPVFKEHAIVLLILDPANTVDVLDERSRVRALLIGTASDTELRPGYFLTRTEYLRRASDLKIGDMLVTSGLDRLFPKGIAVGTVEQIENNRFGIFLDAEVVPVVDFSRLEEVLVLKYP